ncbi:hypothetical protein OAK75_01470 [Bacteriovoracales bacterium]|nr:hypothetical protein [Bacteriovoracales bacterium]
MKKKIIDLCFLALLSLCSNFVSAQERSDVIQSREKLLVVEKSVFSKASTKILESKVLKPILKGGDPKTVISSLKSWYEKQKDYQDQLDDFILLKQSHFISKARSELKRLICQLPKKKQKILNEDLSYLANEFKKWEEAKNIIGGPKQKDRLYSYQNYFKKLPKVFKKIIKKSPNLKPKIPPKTLPPSAAIKTKVLGQLRMAGVGVKILADIMREKKRKEGHTPLTAKFNKLFFNWGKQSNFSVVIYGRENLPNLNLPVPDNKTVNLILPSHRAPIPDAILMGNLKLPNYMIFANPKAFMPTKAAAQKLASAPEFLAVGKWRGKGNMRPADKLLQGLKNRLSYNALNYPQGFTATMNEILPITPAFSPKLLGRLIKEGFKVNVVPISYEVGSQFLRQNKNVLERDIEAKIHPSLPPDLIELILKLEKEGMENLFGVMLRSFWLEHIKKYGELRLEQIELRLYRQFPHRRIGACPKGQLVPTLSF